MKRRTVLKALIAAPAAALIPQLPKLADKAAAIVDGHHRAAALSEIPMSGTIRVQTAGFGDFCIGDYIRMGQKTAKVVGIDFESRFPELLLHYEDLVG